MRRRYVQSRRRWPKDLSTDPKQVGDPNESAAGPDREEGRQSGPRESVHLSNQYREPCAFKVPGQHSFQTFMYPTHVLYEKPATPGATTSQTMQNPLLALNSSSTKPGPFVQFETNTQVVGNIASTSNGIVVRGILCHTHRSRSLHNRRRGSAI